VQTTFNQGYKGDEDCLFLNVYTPQVVCHYLDCQFCACKYFEIILDLRTYYARGSYWLQDTKFGLNARDLSS
jgi:hypothetical protein